MICHLWAFTDSDTVTPACLSITATMLRQFPNTSVIAILKSPLISTFISSKNTKPRWLNLSSTICFNQKGRFDYMLSRLFWCKNGATLCAMIFTISHDTTRKRTKSLRYRTLFTIFNAIYAMSITARDNFCLSATLKNPDTTKVFGAFFFLSMLCLVQVWCKSIEIISRTTQFVKNPAVLFTFGNFMV